MSISNIIRDRLHADGVRYFANDNIADYITEEQVTAAEFYFDLKAEVQSWIDYHKKEMKRAEEFMKLISPIQIQQEL